MSAVRSIPIRLIRPAPDNVREHVGDISELASSINEVGLLNPLLVIKQGDYFLLVAGHRRLAALRSLGRTEADCFVRPPMSDVDRAALMLIENTQRVALNPIERALTYRRMAQEFGLTHKQVAQKVGVSQATVNQSIALLELPQADQDRVRAGKMSHSAAYRLVRLYRGSERELAGKPKMGRPRSDDSPEWVECEFCWGRGVVRKGSVPESTGHYVGNPDCLYCTKTRKCFKHARLQAEADQRELERLRRRTQPS